MSKVSQILGITYTIASKCQKCQSVQMVSLMRWLNGDCWIASFDTHDGSVKSVQMVRLSRWLNGYGWGTGGGGSKVLKVCQILGITPTKVTFDTYEGNVKSVKCGGSQKC